MGVVLFGTPETENSLATEDGGYDNISVVRQLTPPDTDLLRFIKGQIETDGNNPADCILVTLDRCTCRCVLLNNNLFV